MSENARNNGPIAEEESKDPINGGNFLITKDVLTEIDKKPKTEITPLRYYNRIAPTLPTPETVTLLLAR